MKYASKIMTAFGVFMIIAGIIFIATISGDKKAQYTPAVLMFATGLFFFTITIFIRVSPALEYFREHSETTVGRTPPPPVRKEALELPPPPPGIHIPGPSFWPIALAFGAALMGLGLIFTVKVNVFLALGALIVIITGAGWCVQAWQEREDIISHENEHAA